ncbi:hypothetical protein [Salsipaludibacter albus]|uniref:hypothetical protein n=1 Tax=Salsipaludibacter albus TaxID=2849650 RepID=UPI001EE3B1FB|nr:hypothetical protein [Salsipaludibacter albus]
MAGQPDLPVVAATFLLTPPRVGGVVAFTDRRFRVAARGPWSTEFTPCLPIVRRPRR